MIRALVARALAVTMVFGCVAKVYPEADPQVIAPLATDTEPDGTATLPADAGGTLGSAGAGSAESGSNSGGSGASAGGTGVPDIADAGCLRVALFRDRDADGFGSDAPEDVIQGCPPLAGFVTDDGDCFDEPPSPGSLANDVFPGQQAFFGQGYPSPRLPGAVSFDYDCDGQEEAAPDVADRTEAPDCSQAAWPSCVALPGYRPAGRNGPGANPLCGSVELVVCLASNPEECTEFNPPRSDTFRCH